MHTPTQLVPTGAHSALDGARRPRVCPAYRLPQVRERPPRLEPVAPDTFGELVLIVTRDGRGAIAYADKRVDAMREVFDELGISPAPVRDPLARLGEIVLSRSVRRDGSSKPRGGLDTGLTGA
jgi:hypothetical protein